MHMKSIVRWAGAGLLGALLSFSQASAEVLVGGGSTSPATTAVVATVSSGATTIVGTNLLGTFNTLFGIGLSAPFYLNFTMTSTTVDTGTNTSGSAYQQHYSGTFSINSAPSGGGFNYLSGSFVDSLTGNVGATSLALQVTIPPDTLTLNSGFFATVTGESLTLSLDVPRLALTSVTGGYTLSAFSGGSFSQIEVTGTAPEPASMALLGIGGSLMGLMKLRRRNKVAVEG